MANTVKSKRTSSEELRARRFTLNVPARFRADDGRWHRAITENISRSGVRLRAEEAVEPDTAVEMVIELPSVRPGERPAHVVCRGRIVRTLTQADAGPNAVLVATIGHYRLCRLHSLDALGSGARTRP